MDSLQRRCTLSAAGRSAPAPPESILPDSASGRRPTQLDDPVWLRRRYERDGDMAIAIELGVARGTVRAARERLGIEPAAPGRRRGVSPARVTSQRPRDPRDRSTAALIVSRLVRDTRARVPATETSLSRRIMAANAARIAGDELAYDDALIGVASAAGLLVEHRRKLRKA